MNYEEYKKVKDFSYDEYIKYLKEKYGTMQHKYGSKKNRDDNHSGLFIHHDKENEVASLSSPENRRMYPEYQKPEYLTYCNYLEHMLIHNMIGRESDPQEHLGLNGPCQFIVPALINYYRDGYVNEKWNRAYYDCLVGNEDVFNALFDEYNSLVKDIDVVMEENKTLYLQAEELLETKKRALIVLGTGLGKTSTALQYLRTHKTTALVICPNNLIKDGWNKYRGWVDTISYSAFSHRYKTINYNKYGLVILDEVHHAGYNEELGQGARTWGNSINFIADAGIKILGLTATPNRTDGIMLGETLFKDCVCQGRSIEDALNNGDIHPFSYITAIYDTDGISEEIKNMGYEKTDDPEYQSLVGQLNLAINDTPSLKEIFGKHMPDGKRKGIVFIQDISDSARAKKILEQAYPNAEFRTLNSDMDKNEIAANRLWFENTDEGYLVAINMITEGAHYPGVNTLIMFRRTNSYVLYSQQIGRIITLANRENPNAIVFDLVNNINSIRYNDRVKDKGERVLNVDISRALAKSNAAMSNQIVVKDYCQNICKRLYDLKGYVNIYCWEDWEIDILKNFYTCCGALVCREKIDETWAKLHPNSSKDSVYKRSIRAIQGKCASLGLKAKDCSWTKYEDDIIKEFWPLEGYKTTNRLKNRTVGAASKRACDLGVVYNDWKYSAWSAEEDAYLKFMYDENRGVRKKIYESFCAKFNGRTKASVFARLKTLRLSKDENIKHWSEYEDSVIVKNYCNIGANGCAEILTGRTIGAIKKRAQALGIQLDKPAANAKKVLCVETGVVFDSASSAAKSVEKTSDSVAMCCRGNTKTAGGYHWKYYIEEDNSNEQ